MCAVSPQTRRDLCQATFFTVGVDEAVDGDARCKSRSSVLIRAIGSITEKPHQLVQVGPFELAFFE